MRRLRFVPVVAVAIAVVSPALAWGPADQYGTFGPDDDTIYDIYTGLTWQRASTAPTLTQADATATCAALTLGGDTWRLPTMKELLTLAEDAPHTVYQGGADVPLDLDTNAFYDTPSSCFWTSSVVASQAFVIDFSTGEAALVTSSNACAARCVER